MVHGLDYGPMAYSMAHDLQYELIVNRPMTYSMAYRLSSGLWPMACGLWPMAFAL